MSKDAYFSSNRLRTGRWSAAGQVYLVTTVTRHRCPVFQDFFAARELIQVMREDALRDSHQTLAFVVMPDHLHWLLELRQESLSRLVGRVKSISARRIGSQVWQDGFHDRALRKEEDLRAMARYVIANPWRAGLVERIGDYPHWDAVWV
ncbi:REP-associated tyrosine transposase [Stutzerimonas stutzeri]|uniref:Transposase n=1 Tax=Stutzerimonas stutzeri TaxID=316 RepID=A0A6I6LP41_STUST|nr:transposase [Stutzerimonas stutzeri]QGZ30547.1 transposase [Stutzerimonas stutzeri]